MHDRVSRFNTIFRLSWDWWCTRKRDPQDAANFVRNVMISGVRTIYKPKWLRRWGWNSRLFPRSEMIFRRFGMYRTREKLQARSSSENVMLRYGREFWPVRRSSVLLRKIMSGGLWTNIYRLFEASGLLTARIQMGQKHAQSFVFLEIISEVAIVIGRELWVCSADDFVP